MKNKKMKNSCKGGQNNKNLANKNTPEVVITQNPIETYTVYPKLAVLPCLQETKQGGLLFGYEFEQQPGKWDPVKKTISPLFPGRIGGSQDASSYFNRFWQGTQIPLSPVTKQDLLEIPNCSNYGFRTACKYLTCEKKWDMYTQYLCDQFTLDSFVKPSHSALFVTHHNRLASSSDTQGILPFKPNSNSKTGKSYGYANNFCLKIEIKQGILDNSSFSVFERGFPDKGHFTDTNTNTNTDITKVSPSEETYDYIKNTSPLILDPIIKGIMSGLKGKEIDIDIYVIRHGNALHNKPMQLKDQSQRLDSTLTPLGMLQAEILGKKLEPQLVDKNVLVCCSFLQRTQLTALLLLKNAGLLPESMVTSLNSMKSQALIRYKNTGFNHAKFYDFSPIKENPEYRVRLNNIIERSTETTSGTDLIGGKKFKKFKKYKTYKKFNMDKNI